ncbi:MAG: cupin domain-containing protein [Homoserinimonas sp.]
MQKSSLTALARELLEDALRSSSGRSARTVFGGHERVLRQTVIALAAGKTLAEHVNPGEATIYVLRGRVTLTAGPTSWHGMAGDHLIVPALPHRVDAIEDSAILLTVAKLP